MVLGTRCLVLGTWCGTWYLVWCLVLGVVFGTWYGTWCGTWFGTRYFVWYLVLRTWSAPLSNPPPLHQTAHAKIPARPSTNKNHATHRPPPYHIPMRRSPGQTARASTRPSQHPSAAPGPFVIERAQCRWPASKGFPDRGKSVPCRLALHPHPTPPHSTCQDFGTCLY